MLYSYASPLIYQLPNVHGNLFTRVNTFDRDNDVIYHFSIARNFDFLLIDLFQFPNRTDMGFCCLVGFKPPFALLVVVLLLTWMISNSSLRIS